MSTDFARLRCSRYMLHTETVRAHIYYCEWPAILELLCWRADHKTTLAHVLFVNRTCRAPTCGPSRHHYSSKSSAPGGRVGLTQFFWGFAGETPRNGTPECIQSTASWIFTRPVLAASWFFKHPVLLCRVLAYESDIAQSCCMLCS